MDDWLPGAVVSVANSASDDVEPRGNALSAAGSGQTALRGGVLRVGGYLIGILASTVGAAMLFRHLGVITTGRYVTALSLVAVVATFSDLGLTAVGVREISTKPEAERWSLARDLLGLKLVLTTIGGLIVTVIAWMAYSPEIAEGVALAVVGLAFSATQDNFAIALVVDLRLGWVSALDLLRNLLTTLCTVVLVLLDAHLVPFLGISIPVCLIVMLVTVLLVKRTGPLAPRFNPRRWRAFMSSVLPYSLAVAASALYYRVSILLVSGIASGVQLGYFSMSYRVIEVLTVVPTLLVSSAFPILAQASQDDHARFAYAMRRVFEIAVIAGGWTAVSVAVAAPIGIAIIGGATFRPASAVLAFQGIGLGAMFVNVALGYGLLSLGRYRAILAVNTSALLLNIAVVACLTSVDGARGAAIGTGVTEIVVGVAQAWVYSQSGQTLRPSLGVLPRIALAAGLALSPLLIPGMPTLLRLVVSSAIFGLSALALRTIPTEVMDLLPIKRLVSALRGRGG